MTETRPTTEAQRPARTKADEVLALSKSVKEIVEVTQINGSFEIDKPLSDSLADEALSVTLAEAPVKATLDRSRLTVEVGFMFEAVPDEGENQKRRVVLARATYQIIYELVIAADVPNQDAMIAFGEINGRFNATAYWREYLQNSLTRIGLRPYTVPPFDAAARLRKMKDAEKATLEPAPAKEST